MDSLTRWLEMGGYAPYVWPAFAATVVVLAGLLFDSIRTLRSREATLAELQRQANAGLGRRTRGAPARAEETT